MHVHTQPYIIYTLGNLSKYKLTAKYDQNPESKKREKTDQTGDSENTFAGIVNNNSSIRMQHFHSETRCCINCRIYTQMN